MCWQSRPWCVSSLGGCVPSPCELTRASRVCALSRADFGVEVRPAACTSASCLPRAWQRCMSPPCVCCVGAGQHLATLAHEQSEFPWIITNCYDTATNEPLADCGKYVVIEHNVGAGCRALLLWVCGEEGGRANGRGHVVVVAIVAVGALPHASRDTKLVYLGLWRRSGYQRSVRPAQRRYPCVVCLCCGVGACHACAGCVDAETVRSSSLLCSRACLLTCSPSSLTSSFTPAFTSHAQTPAHQSSHFPTPTLTPARSPPPLSLSPCL